MATREYRMTDEDMDQFTRASLAVDHVLLFSNPDPHPQLTLNRLWENLGKRLGFDHQTARMIGGKGSRMFTALAIEED